MPAPIVVDSSVLISLAKLRRLVLLKLVYEAVVIGPVVHHEVVAEGRRLHARGVEHVEQALADGWLRVVRPTPAEIKETARLLRVTRIDEGEAQSLAMAQRRKLRLIADDKEARHVAGALGVDYIGTAGVLLEAHLRKHLTIADLEDAVGDLASVLWLSPSVVAAILKIAHEAKQ